MTDEYIPGTPINIVEELDKKLASFKYTEILKLRETDADKIVRLLKVFDSAYSQAQTKEMQDIISNAIVAVNKVLYHSETIKEN